MFEYNGTKHLKSLMETGAEERCVNNKLYYYYCVNITEINAVS